MENSIDWKEMLEPVLQFACCNSGEERFCSLCPWYNTAKCEEKTLSPDELFDAVYKISLLNT